jgi:2-keto-4-pentenoate hydratase
LEGLDLNAVSVTLPLGEEVLNEGKGSDAMGDQLKTLLWIFHKTTELGWEIEAGHIIITGALGQVSPGKIGGYVSDFGEPGEISFEVG